MRAVLASAGVGFEVFDRTTSTVLTSHLADQRFAAMSQVKLLIALDVLARDNQKVPDDATKQELHQLLAHSDDQVANRFWTAGGGPAIVTRMISRLGLSSTRPPGDPGEWGDTLIGIPHTCRAAKQGWGTSGSQAVMNSTGLVGSDWRYVVIVLARAPVNSYSTLPSVVTAGARALANLVRPASS
jgi:hypothetical protein